MRSLFKNHFNSPMRSPTAEESYAFKLHLTPGTLPYDEATNVPASCSISGVRYGLVKGVVSSFASNVPPVEDKGLRGCPAFTQLAKMTETLTDASWNKSNIVTPVLANTFQGQNIWTLSENTSASVYHTLEPASALFSGIADNSVIGVCVVSKYKGRKIAITGRTKANAYLNGRFNLQTGIIENTISVFTSMKSLGDGYYLILMAFNVGTGATTPTS